LGYASPSTKFWLRITIAPESDRDSARSFASNPATRASVSLDKKILVIFGRWVY